MDVISNKRATSTACFSRRRSNLTFRDPKNDNGGIQSCNRLGCSTRYNSNRSTEISSTEKLKTLRTASRPSSKALNGSTIRSAASRANLRKSKEQKNLASVPETVAVASSSRHEHIDNSKSSSRCMDVVVLESVHTVTGNRINSRELENIESERLDGFPPDASGPSQNSVQSRVIAQSKSHKQTNRQTVSSKMDISLSSPVRRSIASRTSIQTSRPSQGHSCNTQGNGSRNLTCTSLSDVSSGCSSLNSMTNRRMNASKKRSPNGDISTSRGKGRIGSSVRGSSDSPGTDAVPRLERLLSEAATPRTRNQPASRDDSSSIRTQRTNGERRRLSEPRLRAQEPRTQISIRETTTTRPWQSYHREATTRQPSFSNGIACRQVAHHDDTSMQMPHAPMVGRQGSERINMDGIAQVLYALEMIEQEELTREQLLALESNLLLGATGYHDQHRDYHDQHREMRLDIDDMSYEELLALGEKMGTVSTALTEEALSKCLKRSIHEPASMISGSSNFSNDDIKCSICQEEYAEGDEVGKLCCEHLYHVDCIHQWLRQKNWCPICKASASPS